MQRSRELNLLDSFFLIVLFRRWLAPPQQLEKCHSLDRQKGLTPDDIARIKQFMGEVLALLGREMHYKQRCVATASVYFRRFYLQENFCDHCPWLIAPTCLLIASAAENIPIGAKYLFECVKRHYEDYIYGLKDVFDAQLLVLEVLGSELMVFSPRMLLDAVLDNEQVQPLAEDVLSALNDMYKTDLCIMHPPDMLAIAAIVVAAAAKQHDVLQFLSTLDVDMNHIYEISSGLVSHYEQKPAPLTADGCTALLLSLQ